jgi:hypothetical protein
MDFKRYVSELSAYPNRRKKLRKTASVILFSFVERRERWVYEIHKFLREQQQKNKKVIKTIKGKPKALAEKDVRKNTRNLLSLGLIKVVRVEQKVKRKPPTIYYRLTTGGIFNLLSNQSDWNMEQMKNLFENYSDNIIFETFVYPYLKQETILQFNFAEPMEDLINYLKRICGLTSDADLKRLSEPFTYRVLFKWGTTSEMPMFLSSFLNEEFGIKWVKDTSKFEQTSPNIIMISSSSNVHTLKFELNNEKNMVTLVERGRQIATLKMDPNLNVLYPDESTTEDVLVRNIEQKMKLYRLQLASTLLEFTLFYSHHIKNPQKLIYLLNDERLLDFIVQTEKDYAEDIKTYKELMTKYLQ